MPSDFAGGRYEVQRFLGEGGRKRVFLARDTRLDREVAIAVIKTEGLDEDGLARVRREAQAMARLGDHPHIVTVFDIGEDTDADGRVRPYIVSQYMAGGELGDVLRQADGKKLPVADAVRIANQVRMALEHAHSQDIIHRDLKPANIWLTEDGTAKLGDFGLAVALDQSRLTMEGMMVGTVAYMPPEQALGRQPDARSDLYSLGCVLYEMLTGRPPFLGDDSVAIISQHINTAPVAPTWHNAEIPKALESLILRLLAKDPEERPENAAAIPEALNAIFDTASGASSSEQVVANPLDRLAGGVFVGRDKEMDELRAGLEDALSGRGRLLMLVGEPGIGKTRTSEELATYAGLRNVQVVWGRCYEGEGAPAYWPWVQAIRSYVHEQEPNALMSQMGPGAADIAQVVSDVKDRLPGLPDPPQLEPEQARFRLFDSITNFLKNASKEKPMVLVLDDLHWADKPSLLLLQFLARELRGSRLMVLGTYRDVELRRAHPLSQTLGELGREGLSTRILLRGLTEGDVARFIEMTSGNAPPQQLVEAVYRETEGNPFFVNEVVRLLVADGRMERPEEVTSWSVTIPQGVREVVGRRLDHLSDECNRVLTIGAVIGREFDLKTVESVLGGSEEGRMTGDRLLEVLEEAVGARVVIEVPNRLETYSFSHALIRETLYEELSTARRVRLHRQIGDVLEKQDAETNLPQLAYHFAEAAQGGDVAKAVGYARKAGERAQAQFAYEEAAVHYERGLQVLEIADERDERTRCELSILLGEAQRQSGLMEPAADTLSNAFNLAETLSDSELMARSALEFQTVAAQGALLGYGAAVAMLRSALKTVGQEDSVTRGFLLSALSSDLLLLYPNWVRNEKERRELAREAKAIGERLGDARLQANALWRLMWSSSGPSFLQDRLEMAREMVALAAAADDTALELTARAQLVADSLLIGDMATVDAEIERAQSMAEGMREPFYEGWPPLWRGMRAVMEGRYADAEPLALGLLAVSQRIGNPIFAQTALVQLFNMRVEQGRVAELEPAVKGTWETSKDNMGWLGALAYIYSLLNRKEEAREYYDMLAEDDFRRVGEDVNYLVTIAVAAWVARYLDDAPRAEVLYDKLLPYDGLTVTVNNGGGCVGAASAVLGLLASTMARWDVAEAHFEDAITLNERIGARPWVARTQLNYAQMLMERRADGDRRHALELLQPALSTFEELGMKQWMEPALALKLEAQGVESADVYTSIVAVADKVQEERPDIASHAAPDGTVTIMFSDIEGSTAMADRLGDKRFMEVLREHNAIIRDLLQAHEGYEVKSEGDGFMVAFRSVAKAVACAAAVQKAMTERNETAEEQVRVRMGLHAGEVIKEDEDFFGRNVIMAARVASQAHGGEVLASAVVKTLLMGSDVTWGEARTVELKGLSGEHEIWAVEWAEGEGTGHAPAAV